MLCCWTSFGASQTKKDTKHTSGGFTSLDSDDFFRKKFRVCTLSVTVTVARRVILKLNVRSEPKIWSRGFPVTSVDLSSTTGNAWENTAPRRGKNFDVTKTSSCVSSHHLCNNFGVNLLDVGRAPRVKVAHTGLLPRESNSSKRHRIVVTSPAFVSTRAATIAPIKPSITA